MSEPLSALGAEESDADGGSSARRALIGLGAAAVGAGALALGSALFGGGRAGGGPISDGGIFGDGVSAETDPSATPGAGNRPGAGSSAGDAAGGRGAVLQPSSVTTASDRDSSYARATEAGAAPAAGATPNSGSGGSTSTPGTQSPAQGGQSSPQGGQNPAFIPEADSPVLPAGRTSGPLGVPVADTPEARRHLLRRAGYATGAAAEAEIADRGLDLWLADQLDPAMGDAAESTIAGWYPHALRDIAGTRAALPLYDWAGAFQYGQATLARQLFSSRQVYENTVDVFSNLLNVTTPSDSVWATAADYGVKVIRQHAFGRFEDMLLASARHPAMLTYLDNVASVNGEINENYGRELLELHTVGVDGGYTEDDVKTAARILSGRRRDTSDEFKYDPHHHVVGPVDILGFSDANASGEGGLEVGDRFLRHLASLPATATTVARKLAVRFISDVPSSETVEHLASIYLESGTDIREVLLAVFRTPEFWSARGSKVRRPLEDLVGTVRASGVTHRTATEQGVTSLYWALRNIGHEPLGWSPPNGYPDVTSAWMSASQLLQRWNHHRGLLSGWHDGLVPPKEFVESIAPGEGTTADAWADQVTQVLLGTPATAQLRDAVRTLIDAPAEAPVPKDAAWLAPQVAALVLNSPEYAVR